MLKKAPKTLLKTPLKKLKKLPTLLQPLNQPLPLKKPKKLPTLLLTQPLKLKKLTLPKKKLLSNFALLI